MPKENHDSARDHLDQRLDELATYETYTPFSQLYCRLIVAWSREVGREAAPLRAVCERLFDIELWYHQALVHLSDRDRVTHDDVRSVADKRRINLTALGERVEALNVQTPRASVVKHLLLAECHYHLRETKAVVTDLEAAIESGGGHPLVHFALGYNRFDQAREAFADAQASSMEDLDGAEREFRAACFGAVRAFRDGLTGQAFDAQLHFWIGRTLAAAGLLDEAQAALETAARIDPSIFGQPPLVEDDAEAVAAAEESSDAPPSAPITEDEVREIGECLKGSWSPGEVLGEER